MNRSFMLAVATTVFVVLAPASVSANPWDNQINNPNRFKVLADFGGTAVLDRETGVVWERSPSPTQFDWTTAQAHCNLKNVGNRKGWRLPTVQELASLVDPTVASPGPTLPAGHPFLNIHVSGDPTLPPGTSSAAYWTANTWATDSTAAWEVEFNTGVVANTSKVSFHWVWCARGRQGVDLQ